MLEEPAEKVPAGVNMHASLRILMEGLIDYAGLFPPASLDMPTAVRNYAAYRKSPVNGDHECPS